MLILKNALSNLGCAKGRNILIGIIVLVIASSAAIAISVKGAAKKAEEAGLEALSITATIGFDREKLRESGQDFRQLLQGAQALNLSEMQIYAKSDAVQEFLYTISTIMNGSDTLTPVDTASTTDTTGIVATDITQSIPPKGGMGGDFSQGDFSLLGYSSYTAMTNFASGSSKITQGAIFDLASDTAQCIISTDLAAYNNLTVGDAIALTNPKDQSQSFVFTITGLYTYTTTVSDSMRMRFSTAMDPSNQIYMSEKVLSQVVARSAAAAVTTTDTNGQKQSTALRATTSGSYVLGNITAYQRFEHDVRTLGLNNSYTVSSTNLTSYENSLIPLQNTAKFADMLLWIVLGVGAAILIVFNIFTMGERKYEVGVLTAIGMKKSAVALQFVTELLLVSLLAIFVGASIGAISSVPVANALLQSQLNAHESQQSVQSSNFEPSNMDFGGGQMLRPWQNNPVDYVSSISATMNFTDLTQLIGLGILLTMLASLSAVIFVLRYEPLKILSERI